MSWPTRGALAG